MVLVVVLVVLGVVLEIIEVVANTPATETTTPSSGPPQATGNLGRVEDPTRAISGGGFFNGGTMCSYLTV